jgi:hypothetical protein
MVRVAKFPQFMLTWWAAWMDVIQSTVLKGKRGKFTYV